MKSSVFLFGVLLVAGGCFGSDPQPMPEPEPEPTPDGVALESRFRENRAASVQTFSIDAAAGGTVVGSGGTQITFGPGALGLDGQPVEGSIDIELVEVYDRANMVLGNRSTSGVRADGTVEALKSAGQFFVNASQAGAELEVLGLVMVESRPVDPAAVDVDMRLFEAGAELNDTDNWQAAEDGADGQNRVGLREGPDGFVRYSYSISGFGWTNLDRWYNFPGELTELFVQVPEGYDGDNCALFLTYDGEPTALASMDVYDDELGMFTEHYGRIPVGQQVHFILVTEIDGQLHYTIQGATIGADHVEVMAEPTQGTQADLEAAIAALP